MSTSGSYDFSSTRNGLIQAAFRKIGALADGKVITDTDEANKLTAGIAAFNPMLKALMAKGMPLWAITETTIAMSNFTTITPVTIGPSQTISLSYKPLKLLQALRRDTLTDVDIPMEIYTYEQYNNLSNKASTGTPVGIFYLPLTYTGTVIVWTLPDSYWTTNGEIVFRHQRPFQDMDSSSDEPDFPVEWHEAIIYGLAVRLAPEYGLALEDRQLLKQEAREAIEEALSFGTEEGSLFIMPSRRM